MELLLISHMLGGTDGTIINKPYAWRYGMELLIISHILGGTVWNYY